MAHSAFDNACITKQLAKLVTVYEPQLLTLQEAIAHLIELDPVLKPGFQRLLKVKGLGLLWLAVLVAQTNGFEGFANQGQLVSYAGYDGVENQSGKHTGKTRIAKKGNSRLRGILYKRGALPGAHLPGFIGAGI